MTVFSLFPGFVRLRYTVEARPHVQTLPCKPFLAFTGEWFVELADQVGGVLWTTAIESYLTSLAGVFQGTVTQFASAELYTLSDPEADPLFVEAYAPTGPVFTGGIAQDWMESVFTFRTQSGGILRLYLMEGTSSINQRVFPPLYAGAGSKAVADYILSAQSFVFGRDGSRAIAGIAFTTKTNDKLRKKGMGL